MSDLPTIGLATWRADAISRVVSVYDDPDMADGEAMIKVKRGAGDIERFNALIELCDELYPEAAALIRSSKASPKNRLALVLGRLAEVCQEGRTFKATSATTYDFVDAEDDLEEKLQESVKRVKAKPKAPAPASDEAIRAVVKATDPKKPTTRTTKTPVKKAPARATKSSTGTRAAK
jgi:hypothetical protein